MRSAPHTAVRGAAPALQGARGPAHGFRVTRTEPRSAATSRGDRMTVARDRMLSESLTGCVGLRKRERKAASALP